METTCLNCGHQYDGNFCSGCGQKARTHRVTFSTIAREVPHAVFEIDRGFFFTLVQLMKQPGTVIREFLGGRRVRYFSPLSYLIILNAFCSFLSTVFVTEEPHPKVLFPGVAAFFFKHPALMYTSLIPFISAWSWLFNRRAGFNYWEHLVLNTYQVAQFVALLIIYKLFAVVTATAMQTNVVLLLFLAYFVYATTQFFGLNKSLRALGSRTMMLVGIAFTLLAAMTITGFLVP